MANNKEFASLIRQHERKRLGVSAGRLQKYTSQVDIDQIAATLAAQDGPVGKYRPGLYYGPDGAIGTLLMTNQTEVTGPMMLESFMEVGEIGIDVTTAGTEGSLYTVVRRDRGDGFPGDIVHISAALTVTPGAFKSTSGLKLPLVPGLYWVGCAVFGVVTTAPTIRSLANNSPYVGETAGANDINTAAYQTTGVVAAPSGNFNDTTFTVVAAAPRVMLKAN